MNLKKQNQERMAQIAAAFRKQRLAKPGVNPVHMVTCSETGDLITKDAYIESKKQKG